MKSRERTDLQHLRKLLFDFKVFCVNSIDELITELDKPVKAQSTAKGPRKFKSQNTLYWHRRRIRVIASKFKSVTSFISSYLFTIYKFYGIRQDKVIEIKEKLKERMQK